MKRLLLESSVLSDLSVLSKLSVLFSVDFVYLDLVLLDLVSVILIFKLLLLSETVILELSDVIVLLILRFCGIGFFGL